MADTDKNCSDCTWCLRRFVHGRAEPRLHKCIHHMVYDAVGGWDAPYCDSVRCDGPCGPEGFLWEAIE